MNFHHFPGTLLTRSLLSVGRGDTFTINCSGFDQYGVDPAAFQAVFDRKAFRPVINYSIPTQVNISFTMSAIVEVVSPDSTLQWIWYNPFIRWNPEECGGIRKISIAAEYLWLPDIFIEEKNSKGISLKEVWELSGKEFNSLEKGIGSIWEAELSGSPLQWRMWSWAWRRKCRRFRTHHRTSFERMMKMTVGTNQYDQIIFYVAIKRRPRLYVINLLVPSGFLVAIDALSFYLPAESENRAPFKMTLLLGYNVFLLMMNDLLPATGTYLRPSCIPIFPPGVYFALCLSLMVVSLLETIFITYLLHLATTQPPPMPQWLHSLLLYWASPRKCYPSVSQKGNKGLGPTPNHLPGVKEPVELVGKVAGPREAELIGSPESRVQEEQEAQRQPLVDLWVQFSHMMDTLLFRLYLLFMATSVVTVIILWNT
uniref:5-hydroxytryptamine receptor 3D n=1 Tax=Neovison vison TaxID=452646 RepID=A0A8C7BDX7_NEOVI